MNNDHIRNEIGIIALPFCPVPPNLESVLGYNRSRRFVAFNWDEEDETLCFTDGKYAACGSGITNPYGFELFVLHSSVKMALQNFHVFTPPVKHALILDRQERLMYAAEIKDAYNVMAGRYIGELTDTQVSSDLFNIDKHDLEKRGDILKPDDSPTAILNRIDEKINAEQEMVHWLNSHGEPTPGSRPKFADI